MTPTTRRGPRIVEAIAAVFALLLTHQIVWLMFQDVYYHVYTPAPRARLAVMAPYQSDSLTRNDTVTQPYVHLKGVAAPGQYDLRVNSRLIRTLSVERDSVSVDVPLTPGPNYIEVTLGDDRSARRWRDPEFVFNLEYRPDRRVAPRLLFALPMDDYVDVYGLGEPSAQVEFTRGTHKDTVHTDRLGFFRRTVPRDQLLVVSDVTAAATADSLLLDSAAVHAAPLLAPFRRRAHLSVVDSLVSMRLQLTLPPGSAIDEMNSSDLDAEQMAAQFFGVAAYSRDEDQRARDSAQSGLRLSKRVLRDSTVIEIRSEAPYDLVRIERSGTLPFLHHPLDVLSVRTQGGRDVHVAQPADIEAGDTLYMWQGNAQPMWDQQHIVDVGRFPRDERRVADGPPAMHQPVGFTAVMRTLQTMLPRTIRQLLSALLTAIPFIWLLAILRRRDPMLPDSYAATLYAVTLTLLTFHLTITAWPVFGLIVHTLSRIIGRLPSLPASVRELTEQVSGIYPFVTIGIVLLIKPLYRAYRKTVGHGPQEERIGSHLLRWLVFWPAVIVLPIFLLFAIHELRAVGYSGTRAAAVSPLHGLLLVLVPIVAVGTLWFYLYWLVRVVLRQVLPIGVAWRTSLLMLAFPIVPLALDALTETLRAALVDRGTSYTWFLPESIETLVWLLIVTGIGAMLLLRIGELIADLWQWRRPQLPRWAARSLIAAALLFASLPAGRVVGERAWIVPVNVGDLTSLTYIIDYLLPYALLIGLIAYLKRLAPGQGFELPATAVAVGTLIFAYFLTGQSANLLFVPVPLLAGWLLFARFLVVPHAAGNLADAAAQPDSAAAARAQVQTVIQYKQGRRLTSALQKSMEKKFAAAEVTLPELRATMQRSEEDVSRLLDALPNGIAGAKRSVFATGPQSSPWANARTAALWGMVLSIPFQLNTLREYLATSGTPNFPVLTLIQAALFATTSWVLIAFIFGYFFHRLRGAHGVEKGVWYAVALAIPMLLLRVIYAEQALEPRHLLELFQIVTFVLVLALAFDVSSMRKLGYGATDLFAFHGLTTLTAYASSIVLAFAASVSGKELVPLLMRGMRWLAFGDAG